MKKYLENLKKCPLFFGIEDEHLTKMLVCLGARVEKFDKKYTIFAEGSPSKYIGILLSGTAQIILNDYYGNRSIIGNIYQSDVFAESFACSQIDSMPVSITASEPCEVMLINCNHILHTCANNCGFHQQLIFNLMKDLATKNIQLHQRVEITSKRTTREKVMTYLTFQAKKEDSNSFYIPFNRQELADYLEVDRSGLSSEIGKLQHEGILESKGKYFKLI